MEKRKIKVGMRFEILKEKKKCRYKRGKKRRRKKKEPHEKSLKAGFSEKQIESTRERRWDNIHPMVAK